MENFIECYHCLPAHPEYCSVHSTLKLLAAGAGLGSGPDDAVERYRIEFDSWKAKVEALDHPCGEGEFGPGSGFARMPIKAGWLTESRDGRPVAPLMGRYAQYDGGITYIAFNYLNYLIASNDHALVLRFTPVSELATDVEAVWLVHGDAEAGRDYDPGGRLLGLGRHARPGRRDRRGQPGRHPVGPLPAGAVFGAGSA